MKLLNQNKQIFTESWVRERRNTCSASVTDVVWVQYEHKYITQ